MNWGCPGWVGFGIAQPVTSSMKLADMVTAHVNDEDGTVEVVDRYTEDSNAMPKEDCQQDWQVLSGRQVREFLQLLAPPTPVFPEALLVVCFLLSSGQQQRW
jgi:hypothetical protein